jgi:hypothetical protein
MAELTPANAKKIESKALPSKAPSVWFAAAGMSKMRI